MTSIFSTKVRGITYLPCFFFCFPLVNHFYFHISLAKPHDLDEGLVFVESEHSILWHKRRVQVKSKIPTVLRGRIKSWEMGKDKSSAMHLLLVHLGGVLSFWNEYSFQKTCQDLNIWWLLSTSTDSHGD